MNLPKIKDETLKNIVTDLKQTNNVVAVVLGGSYATGEATETSDLDIGIYYFEKNPFIISQIKLIAEKYAVKPPVITDFYGWGQWVNGGAWIETSCGNVDFLYKNIEQIQSTIEKAKNGEWENDFEQQPPYGFSSIIYLAETMNCIPLYDPENIIMDLKKQVEIYPPKLKQTVVQQSLWSAEFAIWHADIFYSKQDIYNVIGCLTRTVKHIITALFSINELYFMGDKRAVKILENSEKKPFHLKEKIEDILCADKHHLKDNIDTLKTLFRETIALSDVAYSPFFRLKNI